MRSSGSSPSSLTSTSPLGGAGVAVSGSGSGSGASSRCSTAPGAGTGVAASGSGSGSDSSSRCSTAPLGGTGLALPIGWGLSSNSTGSGLTSGVSLPTNVVCWRSGRGIGSGLSTLKRDSGSEKPIAGIVNWTRDAPSLEEPSGFSGMIIPPTVLAVL